MSPPGHDGLPEAVTGAFAPEPAEAGGMELSALTMAHYLALKRCCPQLLNPGEIDLDEMVVLTGLMISTTPPDRVAELLRASPGEVTDRTCAFAAKLPLDGLQSLADRLGRHIAAAFATVLPAAGPEGRETEKKTGSAGGSKPSKRAARSTAGRSST